MPVNNNTLPPGLLQTPLGLQNGVITSPAWLSFFAQILAPALGLAVGSQFSVDELFLYRGAPAAQEPNSDLMLSGVAGATTRQQSADENTLAMLSAIRLASQLPTWVLSDTHANRANYPNSAYSVDTLFVETDRLLVFRNTGTVWKYVAGTYTDTLANIPTLGTDDAGLLFGVSDYAHLLKWSGTAWGWGPGDPGSGMMTVFEIDPGTGWHLYDGTVGVTYLKSDGTTGTVTLPDLTGSGAAAAFIEAGSPNSGPTAAVAPTFTGSSVNTSADSAGTPAGANSAPTFTGNPVAAASTNATPHLVAPDVTGTGVSPVTTATGTVSAPVFAGAALGTHQHTVTAAGTVSATGEPRKIIRRPWFRQ